MSSAKLKPVAEINLEEFERRLRASVGPQAGVEDPLAELTRLVDTIGLDRATTDRSAEIERALRGKPKPDLRLAASPPLEAAPLFPPHMAEPVEPVEAVEPPAPPVTMAAAPAEPAPPVAPAAPAPLPPLIDAEPALRPSYDAEDLDSGAIAPPAPSFAEAEPEFIPVAARAAAPPPPRAAHWGLKIGSLIGAAVVVAGAVVVYKVGSHARSGPPPLILASTAPTKVPPPSEATVRTLNESGALLTRDTAQPTPTPPKLVDTPEAPVDLAARPQPTSPPSPLASTTTVAPASTPETPSAPTTRAVASDDASPVAPSSDTPIVATAAPPANPSSPVSDDPSRVKTISVRPDGTLISSGYEAAEPAPSPMATPAPKPTAAEAAAADLPTKLSPPKSAARVVAATTAAGDAAPAPAATPKPKKPKPAPVADANADDAQAPAAAGGGGYAVQLAAPKNESEANALVKRFQGKYPDALGGATLGVRKADRHGETIFRVRALGLSKADAAAMCTKVKAAGGDCFVAKN